MSVKDALLKPSQRIKELEALVELQDERIENLEKGRYKMPTVRQKRTGKSFIRVFIPDTHGNSYDPQAWAAFIGDLKLLKPKHVVMLGDHVDCAGFLAPHHFPTFYEQTDYTFEDDVDCCNQHLDQIQTICPGVPIDYLEGNHEHRTKKFTIRASEKNPRDARFLDRRFSIPSLLHFDKRRIRYVERDTSYDGLRRKGAIRVGNYIIQHGTRCGINAAKQTLEDWGTNVISAHTHRMSVFAKENHNGIIYSYQFACLALLHPHYGDTKASNHSHGYGFQIVTDGQEITIPVPIINGVSTLSKLLKL